MPKRVGMALIYTLLVSAVLFMFASALVVRLVHTLRVVQFDESRVRARALADSGATLATVLMRDRDPWWFNRLNGTAPGTLPEKVPCESLGLDPETLGGRFDLTFKPAWVDPYPVGPQGTFVAIQCEARSQRRQARTAVTVKLTSLALSHELLSTTDLTLPFGHRSTGPIYVNGDLTFVHDEHFLEGYLNQEGSDGAPITLKGVSIRSRGKVQVANWTEPQYRVGQALQLKGTIRLDSGQEELQRQLPRYNDSERRWEPNPDVELVSGLPGLGLRNRDIDPGASGMTYRGGLVLEDTPLNVAPQTPIRLRVRPMADQLSRLSSITPTRTVSLNGCPEGVLAEFAEGKLYLHRVTRVPVGRVYDADMYLHYGNWLEWLLAHNWTGTMDGVEGESGLLNPDDSSTGMQWGRLAEELLWDDPDLPDADYPPVLVDQLTALDAAEPLRPLSSGGGPVRGLGSLGYAVPTRGDYYDLNRIGRGAELAPPVEAAGSGWTVVMFRSSQTNSGPDASYEVGGQHPPLFVRGVVRGKWMVVFDSEDPATREGIHACVLAQHEDPNQPWDPTTRDGALLPAGRPVPAGLRYADSQQDQLVMMSAGTLQAVGTRGDYQGRLSPASTPGVTPVPPTMDPPRPQDAQRPPPQPDYQLFLRKLDLDYLRLPGGANVTFPSDLARLRNFQPTLLAANLTPAQQCFVVTESLEGSPVIDHRVVGPMAGVFVAGACQDIHVRLSAEGKLILGDAWSNSDPVFQRRYPSTYSPYGWYLFSNWPPGPPLQAARRPMLPLEMRLGRVPAGMPRVDGSLHSLDKPMVLAGTTDYDRRFQALTAQQIQQMGLPLEVIPCIYERY